MSDAIYVRLQADAHGDAACAKSPGGHTGNDTVACAAGSHPEHRIFGQAIPGPGPHPTTPASGPPAEDHRSLRETAATPLDAKGLSLWSGCQFDVDQTFAEQICRFCVHAP